MNEHSAEKGLPTCICIPVPRVATFDGRDGWIHVVDDCPQHGRNRVLPPGGPDAVTEAEVEALAEVMTDADCASSEYPFSDQSRARAVLAAGYRRVLPPGGGMPDPASLTPEESARWAEALDGRPRPISPGEKDTPAPLRLRCVNWPPDLTPRAARRRGEGATWTCAICAEQFVLTQGKGDYWFWQTIKDIRTRFIPLGGSND